MRLTFSAELLARLRALHQRQHAEMSADWFTHVESAFPAGAVFLWVGLGYANYLTLDGQVVWTSPDDSPPRASDKLRGIANVLVRGARELALPELVDLLPQRPPDHPACPGCGGCRWDDTPQPGFPEGTVCILCSGLGWLPPSPRKGDADI
jgi:hypothetical protein